MKLLHWVGTAATAIILLLGGWYAYERLSFYQQTPDLRFTITSWPVAELFQAAQSRGFFAREGLHVELIKVHSDEQRAVEAVRQNEADGGVFLLTEPLLLTAHGTPMSVVAELDYSAGADGIVASNQIATLAGLRGRRVVVAEIGLGHVLLREALDEAGLSESDITISIAAPLDALRMFLAGEADALVTAEPYLGLAAAEEASHLLFSSAERPGLIADVIAFRSDVVREQPEAVAKFLRAWFAFVDEFTQDEQVRQESYAVVAITSGARLAEIKQEFKGIKLLTFADNAVAFTHSTDITSLYASVQRLAEFLRAEGSVAEMKEPTAVLVPTFIRRGLR